MISSSNNSIRVLGCRVHMVDLAEVTARMDTWIRHPESFCRRVVVTGFHGIWEAHKSPEFKAILNSAELWVPDGIAPVWVARLKGLKQAVRTPGAEVMRAFFELADRRGYSSYFYGDTPDTLARLQEGLAKRYPGHSIAGVYSPPFRPLTPEEDRDIVESINRAKPDVLWVGLGMPKQDRWIYKHYQRLSVPVAIGVGAAFGFLSGKVKRVPNCVGRIGLEWLWRLACEPRKLWRRDLLAGPQFLGHVLLEMTGLRNYE